jgi:hypothetical protein
MKNIILAIASILMTVLLFTQPVVADDAVTGSGTSALTSPDPGDEMLSQAAALNPKDEPRPCATCASHLTYGRMRDDTQPRPAGSAPGVPTKSGEGTK